VTADLKDRGFSERTDKYLWGVISVQCKAEDPITEEMCETRREITSLASAVYVLLAFALLCGSVILVVLTLFATPLVQYRLLLIVYGTTIVVTLIALLINEIRLRSLMSDATLWGLADHRIHLTLTGKETASHFAEDTDFEWIGSPTSPICVWVALGCWFGSLGALIHRYKKDLKTKSYVFSDPSLRFMRQKSILATSPVTSNIVEEGQAAAVSSRSVDGLIRSRRSNR